MGEDFGGRIDEVRIWSGAKTAAEIVTNYNRTVSTTSAGLMHYFRFDDGEAVTLHYHFSLFQVAGRGDRVGVTVSVPVYKTDLVMPSLYSRIPGVEYSEREIREMLGIDFDGLPNKALIFLPEDWDESIKPWRRDETGPSVDDVRHLS